MINFNKVLKIKMKKKITYKAQKLPQLASKKLLQAGEICLFTKYLYFGQIIL